MSLEPNDRNTGGLPRRKFLAGSAAAAAAMVLGSSARSAATAAVDWPAIRGFNYQPSYGSSGFERNVRRSSTPTWRLPRR